MLIRRMIGVFFVVMMIQGCSAINMMTTKNESSIANNAQDDEQTPIMCNITTQDSVINDAKLAAFLLNEVQVAMKPFNNVSQLPLQLASVDISHNKLSYSYQPTEIVNNSSAQTQCHKLRIRITNDIAALIGMAKSGTNYFSSDDAALQYQFYTYENKQGELSISLDKSDADIDNNILLVLGFSKNSADSTVLLAKTNKGISSQASFGNYYVQTSSFSNRGFANDMLAKMKKTGFSNANIVAKGHNSTIQLGPYSNRKQAEQIISQLKSKDKKKSGAFVIKR
ncbi:MAG: SPOR domain-containing protein [Mariprofundales bacterium]